MDDDQVLDIDEARLIISLKNDEINNMKSSIRANQIRTNLKIADFQYKIQNLQNKVKASDTKYTKSEQNLKKQKQKHEQQLSKLHSQIEKLKQAIEQASNQSKQKQREFKGTLYEQKMKLQKQRQMNYRWACQLEVSSKYFDPQKILPLLKKDRLEDIPTYVDLYKKYMDSQEVLKHSNLQLSTMRSQIMSQMQESFHKLSSYESVMEDLKIKNQELRYQIQQKQNELILRSQQINEKNSMLEAVQVQASTQIQQLNSQLMTLQKQFLNYNEEDDEDKVRGRSKTDAFYIQRIQDIQRKFQMKQMQYTHQLADYEQKIVKLQQDNRQLKSQLQQLQQKLAQSEQLQIMNSNNYEKEIQEWKKMIALMQTSLKDQQEHLDELKRQNEKLVKELNQMMISKRRLVEEYKIAEEEYKMNFISLNEEIDYLRNQLNNARATSQINSESHYKNQMPEMNNNQSRSQKDSKVLKRIRSGEGSIYNLENSRNLLFDLNDKMQVQLNCEQARSNADFGHYQEEPGWSQKYYALLQKHNTFIKKVFTRLKGIKQKQN